MEFNPMTHKKVRPAIPENLPKGYSWLGYCNIRLRTIDELNSYIARTEMNDSPEEIFASMKKFFDNYPKERNTAAGWVCRYIFTHPDLIPLLKRVSDGSYRKNRILLNNNHCVLTTHQEERFLDSLYEDSIYPTEFYCTPETPNKAIDLFLEYVKEDGVIFVQYSVLDVEEDEFGDAWLDSLDETYWCIGKENFQNH